MKGLVKVDVTGFLLGLYVITLKYEYETSIADDVPFRTRALRRLVLAETPQRAVTRAMATLDTGEQENLECILAEKVGNLSDISGFREDFEKLRNYAESRVAEEGL